MQEDALIHVHTHVCCRAGWPEQGLAADIDAAMESKDVQNEVAFGFLPMHIVQTLQDIGDWRRRAAAMDALHDSISQQCQSPGLDSASFPELFAFLMKLIRDPNFKICLAAMGELMQVIRSASTLARDYTADVVTALAVLLGDSKQLIRQQAHMVCRTMMQHFGPDLVLTAAGKHMTHQTPRTREELLNVVVGALLVYTSYPFEWSSMASPLLAAMSDPVERIRDVALEALCLVSDRLAESRMSNVLLALRCPQEHKEQLQERQRQAQRAQLDQDGFVLHCFADSSLQHTDSNVPSTPQSKLARLPFTVPSPGSRGSMRGTGSRRGTGTSDDLPAVTAASRAAAVPQRPRRTPNLTLPSQGSHVPLSFFSNDPPSPPPVQLQPSTAAALAKAVDEKRRSEQASAALSMQTCFSDPPRVLWQSAERSRASLEECSNTLRGSQERLSKGASTGAPEWRLDNTPQRGSEQDGLQGRTLAPMLHQKQVTAVDDGLTAQQHHRMPATGFGRQPMRGSNIVQSAPSSDVPLPSIAATPRPDSESGPSSPSKALRLQSLKQRLAQTRAQTAGHAAPQHQHHLQPRELEADLHPVPSPALTLPVLRGSWTNSTCSSPSHAATTPNGMRLPSVGLPAAQPGRAGLSRPARDGTASAGTSGMLTQPGTPLSRGGDQSGMIDTMLEDTQPFSDPQAALQNVLADLHQANTAKRKELDWKRHQDAVNAMRRLLYHHVDVLLAQLKDVLAAMTPCTSALRSSTARAALLFFRVCISLLQTNLCSAFRSCRSHSPPRAGAFDMFCQR